MSFAVDLHAQTLADGTTVTGNFNVGNSTTNGNLLITGKTGTSSGDNLKVIGEGRVVFQATPGIDAELVWNPMTGSLRLGAAYTGGLYSLAAGQEAYASGDRTIAMGYSAVADGEDSVAFNYGFAEGNFSFATNFGTATGAGSSALSSGYAEGIASTALSMGYASGNYSTALTGGSALGRSSVAAGDGTQAAAAYSVAIGRYNIGQGSGTSWVDTDPLFVIGNGSNHNARHNALTVLKNGKTSLFPVNSATASIVLDPNAKQITIDGQPLLAPNVSGNVGIGTSSPDYPLSIVKNTAGTMSFAEVSGNNTSGDGGSGIILSDNSAGKWTIFQRNQSPANALHFATGEGGTVGNAKMTILQNGNVGIGTTSPSSELVVKSSAINTATLVLADSDGAPQFSLEDNAYGGANEAYFAMFHDGASSPSIVFRSGAAANSYINAGNVGIGTANPTARLHVRTPGTSGGENVLALYNAYGPSYLKIYGDDHQGTIWGWHFDSPQTDDAGTLTPNNGGISFGSGGGYAIHINRSNNVGIGKVNPQARLDVNGDAKFSGAVRIVRQGDILMGEFGNPE